MSDSARTVRDQLLWIYDLGRRATRYWMVVGAIFILGTALSLTLALGAKPQYESEVVLLYQEMISQSVLQGRDVVKSSRSLASRYKEMLFSRKQLSQVVETLGLLRGVVEDEGMVSATEILRQRITFRDNGAGTFRIVYRGNTREEAKDVAALLAKLLIAEDNRVRQRQADTTKKFLEAEKAKAGESLRASELELAEFLALHPEFAEETASASAGAAIRAQGTKKPVATARSGDSQLAILVRQRNRIKTRLENPDDAAPIAPTRIEKTPERIAAERNVSSAERALGAAQDKLADAKRAYTPEHPDYRAALAKVSAAQSAVASAKAALPALEGGSSAPTKTIDREALARQLADLDREIAARRRRSPTAPAPVKSTVATDLVEIETTWSRMIRQTGRDREKMELLEGRLFVANITASSEFADASQLDVIDEAYEPATPAGRSRKLVALAGSFFFALLGSGLALGLALIDDRVFRRTDLEVFGDLPVLVVVPDSRKRWLRRGGT